MGNMDKNAAIIAVGTELLFGQIVNSNAAWLSRELQMLGFNVLYHYTVGDNPARMRATLDLALEDCGLVVTSGGLGPTQDDITKEIIAERFGAGLELNEKVKAMIDSFFDPMKGEMTANNYRQAMVPAGAEVFFNERGTAPGFAISGGGKTVIALPGPPSELMAMFEGSAAPYLSADTGSVIYHRMFRFYGIGESKLETELKPLIDGQTDPTFATYAKEGECSLRIASKRETLPEAVEAVEAAGERVRGIAGDYLYSDNNEEFYEVVMRGLAERGLRISCAESCTGGLFASTLIGWAGASDVFDRGFVTYSNESKVEALGVSADVIGEQGAVSEEVAAAMAEGALERSCADIAMAVTGVAGPGGGTEEKPVGMAWIALADKDGVRTKRYRRLKDRGRNANRRVTVLAMLDMLYRYLRDS